MADGSELIHRNAAKEFSQRRRSAAFRLSRLRVLRMSDGSRQPRRACSTAYRMKRSLPGAVRIGRQHKLHADLLGELAMPFVEIEAVRLAVDLDCAAALAPKRTRSRSMSDPLRSPMSRPVGCANTARPTIGQTVTRHHPSLLPLTRRLATGLQPTLRTRWSRRTSRS